MCKINVKKSILEVVEYYNLEILKIDLMNDEESSARFYDEERDVFSCKVYTTLEDLDFELESIFMYDKVRGMVYCRDNNAERRGSINWDSKAAAFYFGQDFLVHYPSENMVVVGNEFDI